MVEKELMLEDGFTAQFDVVFDKRTLCHWLYDCPTSPSGAVIKCNECPASSDREPCTIIEAMKVFEAFDGTTVINRAIGSVGGKQ